MERNSDRNIDLGFQKNFKHQSQRQIIIGAKLMQQFQLQPLQSIMDNVLFLVLLLAMSLVMFAYKRVKNWIETQRIIRTFELIAPRDEEDR